MLRILACLILLLGVLGLPGWGIHGCVAGCGPGFSHGVFIGQIVDCADEGRIWKSHECTVNLGGVTNGGKVGMVPHASTFYIDPSNAALIKQVDDALISGTPVRITYREWVSSPIRYSSDNEALTLTPVGAR